MTLKEKAKSLRLALGITQQELAKIIGSNQTEVSFIERGFIPQSDNKVIIIDAMYKLHCEVNKKGVDEQ